MTDLQQTIQKHTGNTEFFSQENLKKLNEIMYEYKVQAGTYLFWEGEPAENLYFIKQGRVKMIKSSDEGKQFILYMFHEGDLFGEFDTFDTTVHSYLAEVVEESVIAVIQKKDLEVLLWQHGDLAVEFMRWMGQMNRLTQTKFRDLMMFGKPGALCSTLIRLNNSYGEKQGTHSKISKKLTNTDLGELIGATRESVNRMLGDLKKNHVIEIEHGHIIIKDLDYLRDICHCEQCSNSICRI